MVDAVPHGVAVEDVVDLHREVVALIAEVHAAGGPGDDAVRQLLELREHHVERRGDHELVDATRLVLADDGAAPAVAGMGAVTSGVNEAPAGMAAGVRGGAT